MELKQKAREREGEADRMEKALNRAQGELLRREKELSELRMNIARLQHGADEVNLSQEYTYVYNFTVYHYMCYVGTCVFEQTLGLGLIIRVPICICMLFARELQYSIGMVLLGLTGA